MAWGSPGVRFLYPSESIYEELNRYDYPDPMWYQQVLEKYGYELGRWGGIVKFNGPIKFCMQPNMENIIVTSKEPCVPYYYNFSKFSANEFRQALDDAEEGAKQALKEYSISQLKKEKTRGLK